MLYVHKSLLCPDALPLHPGKPCRFHATGLPRSGLPCRARFVPHSEPRNMGGNLCLGQKTDERSHTHPPF